MDLNACVKTSAGNIRTPKSKLAYVYLNEPTLPKGETDKDKAKYQVSVLFPKDANLDLMVAAVAECIAENLTEAQVKATKVRKPFLKTEEQPSLKEYAEDFPIMIRASAKFKPQIVAADLSEINDSSQIYSGRWGMVSLRPYFWEHPTGGKGVSLGLTNVQLLDHDTPMAGGRVDAADDFTPIAGVASSTPTSTEGLFD
jgi:hypothetical protein